jgi:hypothetical protein
MVRILSLSILFFKDNVTADNNYFFDPHIGHFDFSGQDFQFFNAADIPGNAYNNMLFTGNEPFRDDKKE